MFSLLLSQTSCPRNSHVGGDFRWHDVTVLTYGNTPGRAVGWTLSCTGQSCRVWSCLRSGRRIHHNHGGILQWKIRGDKNKIDYIYRYAFLDIRVLDGCSRISITVTGPWILTRCGLVTPYPTEIWVNIGSGNGVLPGNTWTNVDLSSMWFPAITWTKFHRK